MNISAYPAGQASAGPAEAFPVIYRDLQLRSSLAARWAVFFDALGIPWQYQPPGPAAIGYQPDFLLEGRFWVSVEDSPGRLNPALLLNAARELGFLMILGPVPEPRRDDWGEGDWGWSLVTGDSCCVNQYGFGTWYKDRRPWAHCGYVPPGPGWLTPTWCEGETNCAGAYAAAAAAQFERVMPPLPDSASPIEKQFWVAHCRLGLPELSGLVPQHKAGPYRMDFALPHRMIGIELDGLRNHSKTEDIARDCLRQRWLGGLSWYIIRFGGQEVSRDAEYCVQQAAAQIEQWSSPGPRGQ
jgi:very-short-patch-repair endonuclease